MSIINVIILLLAAAAGFCFGRARAWGEVSKEWANIATAKRELWLLRRELRKG